MVFLHSFKIPLRCHIFVYNIDEIIHDIVVKQVQVDMAINNLNDYDLMEILNEKVKTKVEATN